MAATANTQCSIHVMSPSAALLASIALLVCHDVVKNNHAMKTELQSADKRIKLRLTGAGGSAG